MAKAKEWTLRCTLELQRHPSAVFTTLTYNETHHPVTLRPDHITRWVKKLRTYATRYTTVRTIRFFACGEYGEQNQRPHYHAILYGLDSRHARMIENAWTTPNRKLLGFTKTVDLTPSAIAYVAGYNSKKIGWKRNTTYEQVNPETGELYRWQPPFIQMSRNPGIGGHARQWPDSWRSFAVLNGHLMPPPRYLHEAWEAQATPLEKEELETEKIKRAILRDTTQQRLDAGELIAQAKQKESARRRKL